MRPNKPEMLLSFQLQAFFEKVFVIRAKAIVDVNTIRRAGQCSQITCGLVLKPFSPCVELIPNVSSDEVRNYLGWEMLDRG